MPVKRKKFWRRCSKYKAPKTVSKNRFQLLFDMEDEDASGADNNEPTRKSPMIPPIIVD